MFPSRNPFQPITSAVVLRLLLLLASGLVLTTFFLPWLQMEVVPVEGRHLPQLAAEYYGKGHVMVWMTYLIYLLPAYLLLLIWRLVYNLTPGSKWLAAISMAIALLIGGVLLYFDITDAMNLTIRYGYWVLLAGVAAITVLVWQWPSPTSENAAVS